MLTVLPGKERCNVFLYIDPYGIKALQCSFFDSFTRERFNSIELLINLNSFGFIREACPALGTTFDDKAIFADLVEYEPTTMDASEKSIQELNEIAGGDYWQPIIWAYKNGEINGYDAESKFAEQYCKRLMQEYTYVLNIPLRIKKGQRPKYRMVHATNHRDGCLLMVDNICNRWEALQEIQSGGQLMLWAENFDNQTVTDDDLGCSHGCMYPCYAYFLKKRFGEVESYEDWCEPALVENTLELLDEEIPKFRHKIKMLHLCFTTDPFMYRYKEMQDMSLAAIRKLNGAGINCSVLTKGLLPIELARLSPANEYGITLVSLDENFRATMEPASAPLKERLEALQALHNAGCKTWVSIEPYPTPNIIAQELIPILEAVSFVDRIVFGRMNCSKDTSAYMEHKLFYNQRVTEVIAFCDEHSIRYHIKNGTMS